MQTRKCTLYVSSLPNFFQFPVEVQTYNYCNTEKMKTQLWKVLFVCTLLQVAESDREAAALLLPVKVQRGQTRDIISYINLNSSSMLPWDSLCRVTYLVSQRECVKNEKLFNGKSYTIQCKSLWLSYK